MMRRMPIEQRREELVSAAVRVISRDGVAAATTRRIVAEADMPLGAFHYVFGTQEELMRSVIETITEHERFAAQTGSLDATSMQSALQSGLEAYIDLLEADPEHELVLFELALFARRQPGEGMRAQWATYFATAGELLGYAADLTGYRWSTPVDDVARLLIAVIDGITMAWLADRDSDAARRSAAHFAAALAAHAYAPTSPATDREGGPDAHRNR